jgi:hypothetical protein
VGRKDVNLKARIALPGRAAEPIGLPTQRSGFGVGYDRFTCIPLRHTSRKAHNIGAAGGDIYHLRPARANQQRQARLHRARLRGQLMHRPVAPSHADTPLFVRSKNPIDYDEGFAKSRDTVAAALPREAGAQIVLPHPAASEAKLESPSGKDIHRRGIPCNQGRRTHIAIKHKRSHAQCGCRIGRCDCRRNRGELRRDVVRNEEGRVPSTLNPFGQVPPFAGGHVAFAQDAEPKRHHPGLLSEKEGNMLDGSAQCDLCRSPCAASETVAFIFSTFRVEVNLCAPHVRKLAKANTEFIEVGRKTTVAPGEDDE